MALVSHSHEPCCSGADVLERSEPPQFRKGSPKRRSLDAERLKRGVALLRSGAVSQNEGFPDRRGPMRPKTLAPSRARLNGWTLGAILRTGDRFGLTAAALSGPMLCGTAGVSAGAFIPFVAAALALAWTLSIGGVYQISARPQPLRRLAGLATAFGVAAPLALLLTSVAAPIQSERLALWLAGVLVLVLSLHLVWSGLIAHWRRKGRLTPTVVIVGATAEARDLVEKAMRTGEASVLGIFDDRLGRIPNRIAGVPILGDTQSLLNHRIMPCVDHVVIALPPAAQARGRALAEGLSVLPNQVTLLVDQGAAASTAVLTRIADAPLRPVLASRQDEKRAFVKRAQDLLLGSLGLIAALPAMAVVALAIKLDSPGPVFFRQRRHGFNNEEILVWKFRSMRVETAPQTSVRQVQADDARVTRVGRFIRKTSLDELPQLFNVLKGEMSLVGPRPHAVGMKTGDVESARLVAEYAHRHRMKPGMTGWAAIKGSRGPVDTPEAVRRRVAYDIEYIERQSLALDLAIIAMTIPCLLGDGEAVR